MTGTRLVQLAVLGPAAAGLLWLVLAPWVWPRRLVAGVVALASHGAAWWVFWLVYLGEGPGWRGLSPSLLGATAVAAAEVGILFAAVEAERRSALSPVLLAGLGAATTAVLLAGYTGSLVLLAVAIPIPTLALAATAMVNLEGRPGLVELAAADILAVLGLSVAFERTGTSVIGLSTGLGMGLVLAAAAVKAGAVPGIGTARLVAGGGASAALAAPLRGQGVLLGAVAGLVMAGAQEMAPAAIVAAALAALAGAGALLSRRPSATGAAVIAAGAAVSFLALGLGGGFGARAFLVTFPSLLLAAAIVQTAVSGQTDLAKPTRWRGVLSAAGLLAVGVAVGSLGGAPPGGGFPGTWMTVSLAVARGTSTPAFLLLAAGTLLGLALAMAGGIRLLRSVRLGGVRLALAVPAALALLYVGSQPVRLGVGWWLRVEESLGLPTVLPSAGGPALPAVGGANLVLAVAPGLVLVLAAIALGRGMRSTTPAGTPVPAARPGPRAPGLDRLSRPVEPALRLLRRPLVELGLALVLEAVAVGMAVRLLVLGAGAGFL